MLTEKKLGTCDALLDISSLVQENLDKGFETRIAQIDFSAAFDLVNHRALVYVDNLMESSCFFFHFH